MPSNFAFDVTFDETPPFTIETQAEEVDVSLAGNTSFSLILLPGEKGEKGDKGDKGDQGEDGVGDNLITKTTLLNQSLQNGMQTTFNLGDTAFYAETIQVFRNGLMEINGLGYTATTVSVQFTTAPLSTDEIIVMYEKAQ